jgi:choline dehydrogenase-like flavoprotein
MVDIGPFEFNDNYWLAKDASLAPLPFNTKTVWNKIWQFSPFTRFGDKYRDAIVKAKNIQLFTYANVTDITANENATNITQVTVKNLQGKQHTVKAKYFILACCAIQNARLLLASNKQSAQGLGNDNGLVGRHFMDHLEVNSGSLVLAQPLPLKFYLKDDFITKARAELAVTSEGQQTHKMLNGTVALSAMELVKNDPPMIDFFPDSATKTVQHWPYLEKMFKAGKLPPASAGKPFKEYRFFTRMEQSPNPDSRVTLDLEKDALGVPRANLHWQLTALEKSSIRKLHVLIGQQAGLSGMGRVRMMDWLADEHDTTWPEILGGGWHHMGTTRMSDDPKQGVVDANCKVHNISNLFTAGSSCFTTSGAANPTLTLLALTLRLSAHVKTLV